MATVYWTIRGVRADKTGGTVKQFSGEAMSKASAEAAANADGDFAAQALADTHKRSNLEAIAGGFSTEATALLIKAAIDLIKLGTAPITSFVHTVIDVTDAGIEIKVGGGRLASRKKIHIKNLDLANSVFIGKLGVTNDVDDDNVGIEIAFGESREENIGEVARYLIAPTGETVRCRIEEYA
jgi:hypothetical protein